MPPLRERKEDILPLARYFINAANRDFGKNIKGLSVRSQEILLQYHWPGNARELKHVIERSMILADTEEITPGHLPPELTNRAMPNIPLNIPSPSGDMTLAAIEKAHILNILSKVKGNITHASKILGISRLTLREKIKKYRLANNENARSVEDPTRPTS